MTKKIAIAVLFVLFSFNQINAQFNDDFERYNYTQRISPQSLNWITWGEDPVAGTGYTEDQDGIISNTDHPTYKQSTHFASSGKQALFIGKEDLGVVPQDVVLDLHNKSIGKWKLTWKMFIPRRNNEAYYNFQENTPIIGSGNWAIQVYFDGKGNGRIKDDKGSAIVNFSYPWKEWFSMEHIIDLDNNTIKINIVSSSGTVVIYNNDFLSDSQYLGGVDFFPNTDNDNTNKNIFYIDDVVFEKMLPIEDVFIRDNGRWEDELGNPFQDEPNNSYKVIIREPYVVTSGTSLNCLNLVFESIGSLTIQDSANVVVSGDLTVPSGNKIVIENGGSFVMLNNSATIDMPDTNSFEYTRKSKAMLNSDYTYWSSPVKGLDISGFGSPYVYSFETANYIDLYSGNGYPQTTGSPDQHDDNGDDWMYEDSSNSVILGKGYAVLKSGNLNEQTVTFIGEPNNGFISVPVALSGDDLADNDDWNLIGNPYPSAIDASVLINSNINTSGTLYYWTHSTELGSGVSGPEDENYNPNDYASFNLSGGVAATTGGEIPNGYIAAGQGFFMDVSQNGLISFNNDMRVVNKTDENTQFFKSSTTKKEEKAISVQNDKNKVWLSFTNKKGVFSQSLIAFLQGATDGFESNYDGIRAGTDLNVKFYSVLDEKELAIQGRPVLKGDELIQLGFYITKPDQFIISIDRIEGLISEEDSNVYLIDNELNIIHDLKESDYLFNVSESGKHNDRFAIQFKNLSLGIDEHFIKKEELNIINRDNGFEVRSNRVVESIQIYDLMGRLLISRRPNQQSFYINTESIKKGTLLIIQASVNNTILNKKIVNY